MSNAAVEFTFSCPHCGQHISAAAADAGIQAQCSVCSQAFTVPSPPPPRRPFAGGPRHQTANASPPKLTKRLLSVSAIVLLITGVLLAVVFRPRHSQDFQRKSELSVEPPVKAKDAEPGLNAGSMIPQIPKRKAAEKGDATAQVDLGIAYQVGVGVASDFAEGVKWFRKAAQQDNAKGQSYLGDAYYYGDGVAKDTVEAVKWLRKAADQGNVVAEFRLGQAYDTGQGVAKNSKEAINWYRKAAEQGDVQAQRRLGIIYFVGELGIERDYALGYAWFKLASATDTQVAEAFEEIKKKLSPLQIAEGEKRLKELTTQITANRKLREGTSSASRETTAPSIASAHTNSQLPQYKVTVLESSHARSFGYGINASGQVVGGSDEGGGSAGIAVRWTGTKPTELGTLGGKRSTGYGINANGQVAGESQDTGGAGYPVRWTETISTPLGTFGRTPGPLLSGGVGINASGQVAGTVLMNSHIHAVRWTDTTPTELGTLGGKESMGRQINASGQVAGQSQITGNTAWHAVRWTGTTPTDLGTLGGKESAGYGINDRGQVAGYADTAEGAQHAVRWTGTTPEDLGTLGGRNSQAYGINAAGDVVGMSDIKGDETQHAFLYSGGRMYDLTSLLPPGSGITNLSINIQGSSINDLGQIAASGVWHGSDHALRLDPVSRSISEKLPPLSEKDTKPPTPSAKSAVAANFNTGDDVRIIRQATLTFNGKPFKEVQPGGTFKVAASRPAEKRIYLQIKDATGKAIAVAVEDDAVVRVSLSERAIEAARTGNPKEALSLIQAARKTEPTNSDLARISGIIFEVANATENLKAAAQQQSLAMARVVQLEKNAKVANSPNALDSNDTSYRQRAAKILAEAETLRKAAENMVPSAKAKYETSISALNKLNPTTPNPPGSGGAKSSPDSYSRNTYDARHEDATASAMLRGDVIQDMVTRRDPKEPVEHNLLFLGSKGDQKVFISITKGELFSLSPGSYGKKSAMDEDTKVTGRVALDSFESKLASYLCENSAAIELINQESHRKWLRKLEDLSIGGLSLEKEFEIHLNFIAQFEELERTSLSRFTVIAKLTDDFYECSFEARNAHFLLKTNKTQFTTGGRATLPLRFIKKAPISTKDGFEKIFSVYEEADLTMAKLVQEGMYQSGDRLAALLRSHKGDRKSIISFLETLLAISESARESARGVTTGKNRWTPFLSRAVLEFGFIALIEDRLPR